MDLEVRSSVIGGTDVLREQDTRGSRPYSVRWSLVSGDEMSNYAILDALFLGLREDASRGR